MALYFRSVNLTKKLILKPFISPRNRPMETIPEPQIEIELIYLREDAQWLKPLRQACQW